MSSTIFVSFIASLLLFHATGSLGENRQALIVVIDGLTGCAEEFQSGRHHLVSRFVAHEHDHLISSLRHSGIHATTIFACFGPSRHRLGVRHEVSDLQFQKYRDHLSPIERISFERPFPEPILEFYRVGQLPPQIQSFFSYVSAVSQQLPANTPTYVIGFSYGAWTAMLLTQQKILAPTALITVEAISPIYCNMAQSAKLLHSDPGCLQPPPEFNAENLNAIRAQSGVWLNAYQTQFRRLHSGPIAEASENWDLETRRHLSNAIAFLNDHHVNAWRDHRVWSWLHEKVKR